MRDRAAAKHMVNATLPVRPVVPLSRCLVLKESVSTQVETLSGLKERHPGILTVILLRWAVIHPGAGASAGMEGQEKEREGRQQKGMAVKICHSCDVKTIVIFPAKEPCTRYFIVTPF